MLDPKDPVPLYHQLELRLRRAIESGQFRPGDRLPTEAELQRLYGVSRATVRAALRRLEEDGLLWRHRGRGTFVHPQAGGVRIERNPARLLEFEQDILRSGFQPRAEVLSVEQVPAPDRVAEMLRIGSGREVLRVRRLGWADGEPLWLESRYLHPEISHLVSPQDFGRASVTRWLQAVVGIPIAGTRLRVTAGAATPTQARYLGTGAGAPVLINEFVFYDAAGRPVEAARAVFRADRYAFVFEVFPATGTSSLTAEHMTTRKEG